MTKPTFSLHRIIGNELPVRDAPGARLEAYRFILDHEPTFPAVTKSWLINRVYCQTYLARVLGLLQEYNARFDLIPFVGTDYRRSGSRNEKTLYAVNANVARNQILATRKGTDFAMVFDGECMLTADAFHAIANSITGPRARTSGVGACEALL